MQHLITMLTVLVATTATLVYFSHRLGQSSILAYLLTGILLGPDVLNLFSDTEMLHQLGDIGVIFLLFFVGLEFHLDALKRFARLALLGGSLQILLTTGLVAVLAAIVGLELGAAFLIGVMIALSSTALVVKVFEDRHEIDGAAAQAAMALLVTQDLAAMITMAGLPLLTPQQDSREALRHLALLLAMLPVLFLGYRMVLPRILRAVVATRQGELFALAALGVCLTVAALAEQVGASLALGAFLGGVILCESPVAHQIRGDLAPFKHITLALFFISVGMLLDLGTVVRFAPYIVVGLIAVLALKTLVAAAALRMVGETVDLSLRTGIALCQVGEFSFILAQVALHQRLMSDQIYQCLLAITLLSMALTPAIISRSDRWSRSISRALKASPVATDVAPREGPQAVVVGYGPVGSRVRQVLEAVEVRTVIVDLNLDTVNRLSAEGIEAVYGDAARREVLLKAGLADARLLVITLPDLMSRMAVLPVAESINPNLRIFVRARYLRESSMLQELGSDRTAYEELEVSLKMADQVLEELGMPRDTAEALLERLRKESA